jgi:RNA recognition motif-containing protein
MGKRIYVGNISFECSEDDLRDMFGQCGDVTSVSIISDRMTGRSRGFGFVEMSSDAEAEAAIERLNGQKLGDRTIVVNEARPQGGGAGGGRRGGDGFRDSSRSDRS